MAKSIVIIGGGPAGLMAAEVLSHRDFEVSVFEAMPSVGRKFLMAGKSGLNLSHNEPVEGFLSRYHGGQRIITPAIKTFNAQNIRDWAAGLGIKTFVGTSGRIFPEDFKAAPLLRAWVRRLKASGVTFHVRHRWIGLSPDGTPIFTTPDGTVTVKADAFLLALGGASWPSLGSDGKWKELLEEKGAHVAPFRPANCGFHLNWSDHFKDRFVGEPVKSVCLSIKDMAQKGDFVISAYGIEGSAVYGLSRPLRDEIETNGQAKLMLDLAPDLTFDQLSQRLNKPQGKQSLANHIRKQAGLKGVKAGLLRECLDKDSYQDMNRLAAGIKALPLVLTAPTALETAISTAGGLSFDDLDENLMIKSLPGFFAAGEMLDWEAPTGGYLLTACFALGCRAAKGIENWIVPAA